MYRKAYINSYVGTYQRYYIYKIPFKWVYIGSSVDTFHTHKTYHTCLKRYIYINSYVATYHRYSTYKYLSKRYISACMLEYTNVIEHAKHVCREVNIDSYVDSYHRYSTYKNSQKDIYRLVCRQILKP